MKKTIGELKEIVKEELQKYERDNDKFVANETDTLHQVVKENGLVLVEVEYSPDKDLVTIKKDTRATKDGESIRHYLRSRLIERGVSSEQIQMLYETGRLVSPFSTGTHPAQRVE